jgi:hypothetical protein
MLVRSGDHTTDPKTPPTITAAASNARFKPTCFMTLFLQGRIVSGRPTPFIDLHQGNAGGNAEVRRREMPRDERSVAEFARFVAVPFDMSNDGFVAGEPASCASPAAAIACAQGLWKVFGHAGAVAFVRNAEPASGGTVLRRFGNVPGALYPSCTF